MFRYAKGPTNALTYLLTAWSTVLLEKLTSSQLVKKFPTPTIPLTAVLPNRQVFLPDPVYTIHLTLHFSCGPASWSSGRVSDY